MSNKEEVTITVLIKRCYRLINTDIDQTLKQFGIARSQYRILYLVAKRKDQTQTDLIKAMEVKASTLTPIVDNLVKKGWLIRVKNAPDRRVNILHLTPVGEKVFHSTPDPARKIDRTIMKNLSKEERETFIALLNKIMTGLQ